MKRAIVVLIVLAASGTAQAQSPQGAVDTSYDECPPELRFDPRKEYDAVLENFGTTNGLIKCRVLIDQKPDGDWCQVAMFCENAT